MIHLSKCEVNITRHCNNHCATCNHGSPFAEPYYMEPATLERDFEHLRKVARFGLMCLQGGEPLLHPRLLDFLDVLQRSGIADRYGILTNGRLLWRMPEEFYAKCGEMNLRLQVSLYPNLAASELDDPMAKAKAYGFEFILSGIGQFTKLFKDQPDGGREVWSKCPWRICYTVHEGYFFPCPLVAFFPQQFFGKPWPMDGIQINGLTEEKLKSFIDRPTPPFACSKCAGASGEWISWHQTYDYETWLEESTE